MCKYSSEFCGTQLECQSRSSTPCISLGLQHVSATDSTVKQHTKKNHSGFTSPCKQNQVLSVFTIAWRRLLWQIVILWIDYGIFSGVFLENYYQTHIPQGTSNVALQHRQQYYWENVYHTDNLQHRSENYINMGLRVCTLPKTAGAHFMPAANNSQGHLKKSHCTLEFPRN